MPLIDVLFFTGKREFHYLWKKAIQAGFTVKDMDKTHDSFHVFIEAETENDAYLIVHDALEEQEDK
jgi:hypothetical protein